MSNDLSLTLEMVDEVFWEAVQDEVQAAEDARVDGLWAEVRRLHRQPAGRTWAEEKAILDDVAAATRAYAEAAGL